MARGEASVNDDDRIGYLAGEPARDVGPDERADLDGLRSLLADPAVWADAPAPLEDAVVASVTRAADRAETPTTSAGPRGRPARLRLRLAAVGVAAAIAVAAVMSVALSNSGARPLRFEAALSGTALAPAARGSATLTKTVDGWRVTLRATGLPRLDNGEYYEAWLKNPAGILVPIGTFNLPGNITLWSGVPPTSFPILTVTRQQANGIQDSSGQRVLTGTARRAS
jgi:Anti-sigma-K factor rskA